MYKRSKLLLGTLLLMKVKNANIFYFYFQLFLKSLVNRVIKIFVLLKFLSNIVLAFAFGVDLTICVTYICFYLTISNIVFFCLTVDSINFWCLIGENTDF